MNLDRIIGMLVRAAMETFMRHFPRWMARRDADQSSDGKAGQPRVGLDRSTRQKIRTLRRLGRWLR